MGYFRLNNRFKPRILAEPLKMLLSRVPCVPVVETLVLGIVFHFTNEPSKKLTTTKQLNENNFEFNFYNYA
jgi:hypothetical protein